jgi:DNA invertase Pin-like site-specific DNA recombinase
MTTYAYIRVSTAEQVDNSSMQEQRRQCKGNAITHGLYLSNFIEDAAVSGAVPFFERIEAKGVSLEPGDVVIVSKLDRFSRDAADALNTIKELKDMGVKLIINGHGDVTDDSNIMARLMLEVMAVFAGHERRVIKARQKDGQAAKRARGGHIGGSAKFGYRVEGRGHNAVLVQDEAQQAALKDALAFRRGGLSLRHIATQIALMHNIKVSHEALRKALIEAGL